MKIRIADKPRRPESNSNITSNRRALHRNPLKSRSTAQPVGQEEPLCLPRPTGFVDTILLSRQEPLD